MFHSHTRNCPASWLDAGRAGRWGLVVALLNSTAVAQNSSLLEEVTVTAQRRAQDIQDVGISITSFSGEQLKSFGFNDSVDIARLTPGVSVSGSYGGQMSQFSIRGVTQNDFNDHVESVIAVYIDDAYIAMQQGQTFSMFDIERVEVLKGPQGTLFGRNATGGLVHYLTRKPTDTFEAYADVSYGRFDEVRVESAVSGPLADGVRGRLSGFFTRYDGFVDNKYPEQTFVPGALQGNLNNGIEPGSGDDLGGMESNWALRGQLEFDVSDSIAVWVSGSGSEARGSTAPYQNTPTVATLNAAGQQIGSAYASPGEVCESIQSGACLNGLFDHDANAVRERPGADFFGYLDPDGNDFTTASDFAYDDGNKLSTYGATAKITVDADNFTFTSVTDYKDFYKRMSLDLDGGPVSQFFFLGEADTQSITQEFRLEGSTDRLEWIAGFYYLHIDNQSTHGIGALPGASFPIPSWDQPRIVDLQTNSYSLFGQIEYALSNEWTLVAGLRGTYEEKDYDFEVLFVSPTSGGDPTDWEFSPAVTVPGFTRAPFQDSLSEDLWTWKAQLNWTPNADWLLYGGITQGVKAASFNAGDAALLDSEIPYDSETLRSFELGFKSTLADGRVRFNGSAFYYDYSDYQATRWLGVSSIVINADATVVGFDAELMATLTRDLELLLTFGYQDSEVEDVPIGGGFRDVETTFAPNVTASGMVRYYVPQPVLDGSLSLQADANYQSSAWHNLSNFDSTEMDGYVVGNLRATWTSASEHWRVDAFVKNVSDSRYDVIGFDTSQLCGCNLTAQGRPRWWGLSVRYEY